MKNRSNLVTIILISLIVIILLVISIFIGIKIFKKDEKIEKQNEEKEQNEVINHIITYENNIETENNVVINTVDLNELINGLNQINIILPQQPTTQPKPIKKVYHEGFVKLGTIEISKTGISYPILDDISQKALDTAVGVLYPTNARLNEEGNVVIIGHNYKNGKFFSNNKKLQVGDKIKITDNDSRSLTYTIYEIFETTPEDTEYITRERPEGSVEISLSTCTDDVKNRLIILARAN